MSAAPEAFLKKFGVHDLQLKFGKIEFDDIRAWEAPIERMCFVEHLFPKGELVAVYGNPKDGKSHVVTYLLYRASLGLGSFGLDAIPCRVVYLALEGGNGFRNRVLALKRRFGESENFFPMRRPLSFLEDQEGVRDLVAGLRALKADVVVVDTVTRALPGGDQNGQEAFSKLVGIMDGIRAESGVCAVLVHHAGASGRMMGSTVLPGALDVLAKVHHDEVTGIRTLKVEDARDDEAGRELSYRIESLELGTTTKGKPIKTGVVVECDEQSSKSAPKLAGMAELHYSAIRGLIETHGEVVVVRPSGPRVKAVGREQVRRVFSEKGWLKASPDEPMTEKDRDDLRRWLNALEKAHAVMANRQWVWLR